MGEAAELPRHGLCRHRPAGPAAEIPLLYPYRHSGDARYLPKHPEGSPYRYEPGLLVRLGQIVIGLVQFLATWRLLGIKDHSVEMYAAKLASVADARTQAR